MRATYKTNVNGFLRAMKSEGGNKVNTQSVAHWADAKKREFDALK